MPDSPPPADDLRLARQLDAGAAPDGTDPLHDALLSARPAPLAVEPDASERLWAGIDAATREGRPALRLVRVSRWAVAAAAVLAVGAGLWFATRGPDVVAVAQAEVETWAAPDGSTVTLRPNSRLVRLGDRAYRVEGEAFFAVAPDPDRPFSVETNAATVTVLGTRFDVSTWGDRTAVFVDEGRVEVRGPLGASVLGAGESATVAPGGRVIAASASAASALDWQRGEAVFEREPVERVLAEVGQHFGITVSAAYGVEDQAISGVLSLDSPAVALDALGRILGGRFVPDGDGFRFEIR